MNPFDQPGVEAYKKNMFALLEKPGYEEASKAIKASQLYADFRHPVHFRDSFARQVVQTVQVFCVRFHFHFVRRRFYRNNRLEEMEKATDEKIPYAENPAAIYATVRNALYRNGKKTEILALSRPPAGRGCSLPRCSAPQIPPLGLSAPCARRSMKELTTKLI